MLEACVWNWQILHWGRAESCIKNFFNKILSALPENTANLFYSEFFLNQVSLATQQTSSYLSVLNLDLYLLGFIERISFTHKFHLHPFLIAPHALWQSQSFLCTNNKCTCMCMEALSLPIASPTFAGASLFPYFLTLKSFSPHIPPLVVVSFHVSFPYQMIISKVRN